MKYIYIEGEYYPEHCRYGPRQKEGIVLSNNDIDRINTYLLRKKREDEFIEKEKIKRAAKIEASKKMIVNWENTFEFKRRLNEEKRLQKIQDEKQKKLDYYHQIVAKKKEEQVKNIEKTRDLIFKTKECCNQLKSSLMLAEVLRQRKNQMEFNAKLKEREATKRLREKEDIMKSAYNEIEEMIREKQEEKMKKQEYGEYLRQEIECNKSYSKYLKEEKKQREKEEFEYMERERERVIKEERERKEKKKQRRRESIEKTQEFYKKLEETKQLNLMEEEIKNEIFNKARDEIDELRKKRERRTREEVIERREMVTEFLSKQLQKKDISDEIMNNARIEKQEDAKEVLERKLLYKSILLQELKEAEELGKRAEEEKIEKRKEELKWAMLQRMKNDQVNKDWCLKENQRKKEVTERTRDGYLQQIREHEENERRQINEEIQDRNFAAEIYARDTDKFIQYATSVITESEMKGRPLRPLIHCLEKFKEGRGITRLNKNTRFLQSRVPIPSVGIYETGGGK